MQEVRVGFRFRFRFRFRSRVKVGLRQRPGSGDPRAALHPAGRVAEIIAACVGRGRG